jgi:hypothetical protein
MSGWFSIPTYWAQDAEGTAGNFMPTLSCNATLAALSPNATRTDPGTMAPQQMHCGFPTGLCEFPAGSCGFLRRPAGSCGFPANPLETAATKAALPTTSKDWLDPLATAQDHGQEELAAPKAELKKTVDPQSRDRPGPLASVQEKAGKEERAKPKEFGAEAAAAKVPAARLDSSGSDARKAKEEHDTQVTKAPALKETPQQTRAMRIERMRRVEEQAIIAQELDYKNGYRDGRRHPEWRRDQMEAQK